MSFHVEILPAPIIKLARSFDDGKWFGDEYDSSFTICIYPGLFIELIGLSGDIPRKQYKQGIDRLRELANEFGIPVVAERTGKHKLPFFELDCGWWFLNATKIVIKEI